MGELGPLIISDEVKAMRQCDLLKLEMVKTINTRKFDAILLNIKKN